MLTRGQARPAKSLITGALGRINDVAGDKGTFGHHLGDTHPVPVIKLLSAQRLGRQMLGLLAPIGNGVTIPKKGKAHDLKSLTKCAAKLKGAKPAFAEENQYNRIRSLVNEELKQYFRPEFLNRLDEIIVFRQLNRDEVKEIAEIMLREVFGRIGEKGITLTVSDAFKERLVEEGYNPAYGARPLRRAVMRLLEDSLAEEVLTGRIKDGDEAEVDVEDGKVVVKHLNRTTSDIPELASAGR